MQSLLEAEYGYATTDIKLPAEVADFLLSWNQLNIPEDALHVDEDGGKGREREPHVTVKYGLIAQAVPEELRDIAQATAPFSIMIGVVSLFANNPKYDVVKLDVESPALRRLNKQVSDAVPHEDTYPDYHPHLTLAYVEKGSCDHLVGEDPFKTGDMPREFRAAGMSFSAAGDDEDPERVKETLLFSRTRKLNPVIGEAVVGASPQEVEAVIKIMRDTAVETQGDVNAFVAAVNEKLAEHMIQFGDHPELVFGSEAVADPSGVFVKIPDKFQLTRGLDHWLDVMQTVIHHELVHIDQMSRATDPDKMADSASAYIMKGNSLDNDRYLQQKQEVMAWASSMVDAWRRQGLSTRQMRDNLRQGRWNYGSKYWMNRHRYPKTFSRFVKQASEYIDKLEEKPVAETVTRPDPFAQCHFPADPDRVKDFLRSNGKRRDQRSIL